MIMRRRTFMYGIGAAMATASCSRSETWSRAAYRRPRESRVAVLKATTYERPLTDVLLAGLRSFGLNVHGKRVVLKPNLVEFDPAGVINTHPMVIASAIEAFRRLGAREVTVAEGPGHRRDNEYLLGATGLAAIFKDQRVRYVDLNFDELRAAVLESRFTSLGGLKLPETVLDADLLVSMPKLKTHHWAGVTLSMKNMFGIVPGAVYGWPKNVLHWAGIDGSIVDINSALRLPRFAIVDGIVGMEGNGPIQGTPKASGVLILGDDPVAVDASAARLMSVDPARVTHIERAGEFLGNLAEKSIVQIGEPLHAHRQDFAVLEQFQRIKNPRSG